MMIRAFLVDDEPPARARLRQLLTEAGDVLVVGESGDAAEAWSAITTLRPDVVFLDIDMPDRSGTELAASLPLPRPFIVFATAYDRYALEAFAVDATDYLLKPISRQRLSGTLDRVRERLSRRSDLERELAAASIVQARLLPRVLPAIAGYSSAAATIPARGVGGDFYLSQGLADARHGLALGDVAGKGVPAGLVASSLQARLEALAQHAPGRATTIVGDVNRVLCAASDGSRFVTLVYMDLDPVAGAIEVVNAGHLPVIVVDAAGGRRLVESTGPALGLLPDASFDSVRLPVAPGAVLVAYSDGVTEALDAGDEEYGEARLAGEIERGRALPADALCQRILDSVHDHRQATPAADDITVMVIARDR